MDEGYGITYSNNMLYTVGLFNLYDTAENTKEVLCGSHKLTEPEPFATAHYTIYVAGLDASSGACSWITKGGQPDNARPNAYSVAQGSEMVFVTGDFTTTMQFGELVVTSAGGIDIFVVALNMTGFPLWLVNFGSEKGTEYGRGIVYGQGTLILLGQFNRHLDFGRGVSVTGDLKNDGFVASLNISGGNPYWVKNVGGPNLDVMHTMSYSGGILLLTGSYRCAACFGYGEPPSLQPSNPCVPYTYPEPWSLNQHPKPWSHN